MMIPSLVDVLDIEMHGNEVLSKLENASQSKPAGLHVWWLR